MERRAMLGWLAGTALAVGTGSLAAAAGATIIRINIPGPNMLPYLPIELIPRLGIDRALGVQLAIRYMPSGVFALDDVVAGNGDFAGLGFAVLPNFAAKGKPVAAIAALSSGVPPYSILIRPELAGKVRSVADLKGRSIGTPLGSVTSRTYLQSVLILWLAGYGLRESDVRWVQANQNLEGMYGSLASGVVDAVFCEEPLAGTLVRKQVGRRLASMADPRSPGRAPWAHHLRAVIAAPKELLGQHPERPELMARMLQQSLKWLRSHPAAEAVAQLGIPDAELARDLVEPLARMPGLYSPDGRFQAKEIEASRAFLKAAGIVLPSGVDLGDLIADRWVGRSV